MTLTHLSLFTGIGGIDLAAEWAGFKTVGQVEQDQYALKVLEKNFGNVPRWTDIRNFTREDFIRRTGIEHPTLVTGGFPCQPFSIAGKQLCRADDNYLWHEMFRIVSELRPAWVVGENVTGIVRLELDTCLSDLESAGYQSRAFIIPACAVGAPHRRDRVFIVANSTSTRLERADTEGDTCTGDALPNLDRGDGRPIGGKLNPDWVEWLMGFPIGWTDCGASETQSCHSTSTQFSKQSRRLRYDSHNQC